jgi:glycosyltransferase involved in cell wall biosynthesis
MSYVKSRVSIVVASFNHSEFLAQRMESLIQQSYFDIEIIVIDDASTDASLEVLKVYEMEPRVQVLKLTENSGWVKVSNLGAEIATGEFLIFANCDDYCDPQQVAKLVKAMNNNPTAGLSFSRSNIVDKDGILLGNDYEARGLRFKRKCASDTLISRKQMTSFLFHSIVIPNLSAAIFRRSTFLDIGKFSEQVNIAADWEIYFRMAERCDVAYLSETLNFFRSHDESIRSHTKVRAMQKDIAQLLLDRVKNSDRGLFPKLVYRHRLVYLLILVIRKPLKSDVSDFLYLIRFACTYDVLCLFVLPFAAVSRFGRIPLSLGLKLIHKLWKLTVPLLPR